MFWCAFLVHHLDEAVLNELLPVVLAAAAVHDTYRESTQEDQTHGRAAAGAHQETIARVLTNPQSLASCLSAITHHCVPDQQCPMQDTALQVLKDADALDRGRFGAPDKPRGCDTKYFRTETLRLRDVRRNIAWMAFWAAQGTRHTLFGSTPCAEFVRSFCDAVNSLASKPRA